MSERIDELDNLNLFYLGPAEFLTARVAEAIAAVPQFATIFGNRIDAYERNDYSTRELPALRIYCETWSKEFESWFINGELILDVILPPSIRRTKLQSYSDTLTSALCQQFRRPTFFADLCALVPGLNELGKTFSVDRSLGFVHGDNIDPVTQIRANFRIDLRIWDEYLTSDDRTKDDPFEKTLGALERIHANIIGQDDANADNVIVESLQEL